MADYSINVGVKLNTKDIDTQINGYKPNKPIKVKADFDTSDITKKINSFKTQKINVDTMLKTDGITNAIRGYKAPKKIHLESELSMKNVNDKIKNHKPTSSLKLKVELDKSSINQQITSAKPKQHIKINAKLDSNAISNAIKNYKSATPVTVKVKPDFTKLKNELSNYKSKQISVDVKLKKTSIDRQITDYKSDGKKITLGVRVTNKSISDAISEYKKANADKIKIPVDLTIKPNTEFDSKLKQKIAGYEGTPITIPAKLVPYDKGFSSQIQKVPVPIEVTLKNASALNQAIKDKTGKQVPVNVKLTPSKNFDSSIKNKTIPIHIKLIPSEINKDIKGFIPTSKLKVGIDLQINDINTQIEQIHPTSKIKVFLDVDNSINGKNIDKLIQPSAKIKLDKDDINKQIKDFDSKVKIPMNLQVFVNRNGQNGSISQQVRNAIDQALRGITANTPVPIRIELEPSSVQNVQNQINDIREELRTLEQISLNINRLNQNNGGRNNNNNNNWAYTELRKLQRQSGNIASKMIKLDESKNIHELEELSAQLVRVRNDYETFRRTFGQELSQAQLGNLAEEIQNIDDKLRVVNGKLADTKIAKSQDIKDNISNGTYGRQVNSIIQDFNRLGIENQQVTDDIIQLQTLLGNMESSDNVESVIADYENFSQLLKTVKNGVSNLQMEMNEQNRPEILDAARESAMHKLNGLFEEGSQASRVFGNRARQLRNELNACGNVKGIDIVNTKIKNLSTEIKNSKLQTQTFGSRLKEQFSKYSQYLSVASVFMYVTQAMKSMFDEVVKIDSAMTELKKVTDETDASYNQFLSNASSRAKEIGTTIDGLVSSTADFARLGYGFEDAQGLAEVANIYAVVGDEVEGVEGATESLISTMAAFKDEMSGVSNTDFAMGIIDKFNEIGKLIA